MNNQNKMIQNMDRYSRQIRFKPIGEQGQRQLAQSRALLIGCGAIGSTLADILVRAGVGYLRIVDRDFVELSNLQRQSLFDEYDVTNRLPKAVAARRKLNRINSQVQIEDIVEDANPTNVESWVHDTQLILDGTDNFDTRFLINDVAVKHRIPWIYSACVAATGAVMPVIPDRTLCLRCLLDQSVPPELNPTCETDGILPTIVRAVASFSATQALKILTGNHSDVNLRLVQIDLWAGRFNSISVARPSGAHACRCCVDQRFDYLEGDAGQQAISLCGRNSVQINPQPRHELDLDQLAEKLTRAGARWVVRNPYMLTAGLDECELAVFPTGRAVFGGTTNPTLAKSLYAKYIGV